MYVHVYSYFLWWLVVKYTGSPRQPHVESGIYHDRGYFDDPISWRLSFVREQQFYNNYVAKTLMNVPVWFGHAWLLQV